MQVLIVDDDPFHLKLLDRALVSLGHTAVPVGSGEEALEVLRQEHIRLVITDWEMAGMNGLEVCRAAREEDFNGYVYIIMLTGHDEAKSRRKGMNAGADAFISKPLDVEELEVSLKTAERILSLETRDVALFALAKLAESRDPEAGGHVERVQSYTRLVAEHLSPQARKNHGVDAEYLRLLYQTCPLHDLGKVSIPDTILLKPGKLTNGEFEIMKTHTTLGAQTLEAALQRFPNVRFLQFARDIAASHHERFDGTGYPNQLAGDEIPFCGRIVAIADVYDALVSRRVYKDAMSHETAKALILAERAKHFDPAVVDAFVEAEEQITAVQARMQTVFELPARKGNPNGITNLPIDQVFQRGILVVEDSPATQAILVQLLEQTGHPVRTVANAEEAMQIITKVRPTLIVSDIHMPGVSGIELCRNLRSLAKLDPTHFIMLTCSSSEQLMLEAYGAGVDDFVIKPYNPEELLAKVRAGLRSIQLHEQLAHKASQLQAVNSSLAQMNDRLGRLSITDDLTGLFNRRHAMVRLEEQWVLSERYGRFLTVAVVDIDFFKLINDTYGHDAGDVVLKQVAGILKDQTRLTDAVCRIGGEEFLVIFPSESVDEAMVCCQRCRVAMESRVFNIGNQPLRITISIGVATRSTATTQFPDLMQEADKALYAAKNGGRNRVVMAGSLTNDSRAPSNLTQTDVALIDWESVVGRSGGNVAFASAVAARFVQHAPAELVRVRTALDERNTEQLLRCMHIFKSMTAYISADTSTVLCKQIENLAHEQRLAEIHSLMPALEAQVARAIEWIRRNTGYELAKSA
jgi:putative two-component system response regulator